VLLVGLTGGIGSGKSTVARLLEKRGAVVFDAVHHFADKGLGEHGARVRFGNAAHLGVKQRVLVERAHRVAVGAGDVVGVDLQLRLGVHLGAVGEHQGVMAHPGLGVVGALGYDDAALEDAARLVAHHALGQLVGLAVEAGVGDRGGEVRVPLVREQIDPVEPELRMAAGMGDRRLVRARAGHVPIV